jgi:hypothetical protein
LEAGSSPDATPANAPDWSETRARLLAEPALIREDPELLAELGLRPHAPNVVDFAHPALVRRALSHAQDMAVRRELEAVAQANFAAQAQAYACVVDILEARNHADLARRVDEGARLRFGLAAGVLMLEGPGRAPAGWRGVKAGTADALLGPQGLSRMGPPVDPGLVFGEAADRIGSVALVRLAIWSPARQGVLAFGAAEPDGFTADMGAELVAFIARVVERMAERWPVL